MTGGGDRGLLDAWTAALRGTRHDRIVHLADHVFGGDSGAQPWDVASRALLELAAGEGDDPLDSLVACPECGVPVDIAIPVQAFLDAAAASSSLPAASPPVPTVADMAAAAGLEPSAAGRHLASACGIGGLVEEDRRRALAAMDKAHPLLAPSVDFECPSCGTHHDLAIDVVDLAWTALAERARVCLDDVVVLAGAFGWSEEDVLAVPAPRRAVYRRVVEKAGAGG